MSINPPAEPTGQPHPTPEPSGAASWRARHRTSLLAAAIALAVVGALAVGFFAGQSGLPMLQLIDATTVRPEATEAGQTRLEAVKETCAPRDGAVSLGDGGRSLTLSRVAARERPGADMDDLACILLELEVPDAVVSHMDTTRALDGRQQATWEHLAASWTYHPDSGLNVIIQEAG